MRRGMGGFNPKISFTPDNRIQFNRGPTGVPTYPDLRYWDQVRRELSDAAMKAGRGTEENMRLGGLAAALNTELDQLVPAYQTARRTAAGFFDARDALEAGQNFATQRFGANEARAALAQMNYDGAGAIPRRLYLPAQGSTRGHPGHPRHHQDLRRLAGEQRQAGGRARPAAGARIPGHAACREHHAEAQGGGAGQFLHRDATARGRGRRCRRRRLSRL